MRAALYARVSTADQEPANQLAELARYCEARHWEAIEYVDHGVSVAKDRRPALDTLLKDARRRKVDVVVCWRLDRFGCNLKHLITLLDELAVLGPGQDVGCDQRRHGERPHLPHAPRCPTAEGWILATQDRQAVAGRRSDLPASDHGGCHVDRLRSRPSPCGPSDPGRHARGRGHDHARTVPLYVNVL